MKEKKVFKLPQVIIRTSAYFNSLNYYIFTFIGEGKVVSGILREPHSDVKAFPKHHPSGRFGINHPRKIRLSPQMYFNQRLLNQDRRFSKDPCYLFMASYYQERQAVESQINISGLYTIIFLQLLGMRYILTQ